MSMALNIQGLIAKHGRHQILDNVNLHLPTGSITALLGQNGSGKSTLLRCIAGLHHYSQGHIQVAKLSAHAPIKTLRQHITFVPTGGVVMPQETGQTHFLFGAKMYPHWMLTRAEAVAAAFHVPMSQKAAQLSTGQRMGLALAYAFGTGTKLLLLDEPTNGLDPHHRSVLAQLLVDYATNGGSILLSSHVLPEIEGLADRGAFLKKGQIILEAELDELRERNAIIQAILPDVLPAGSLDILEGVKGVQNLHVNGRTLNIHIQGPKETLLQALNSLHPIDIQIKARPLADAYADLLEGAA